MKLEQLCKSRLSIGDHVECATAAEAELPTAGTIVAIRPPSGALEDPEYVVQFTPTILGIYQAEQLIHAEQQTEGFLEKRVS